MAYSYYHDQVSRVVERSSLENVKFQFTGFNSEGQSIKSNWLNFNRESAQELKEICEEFLAKNP